MRGRSRQGILAALAATTVAIGLPAAVALGHGGRHAGGGDDHGHWHEHGHGHEHAHGSQIEHVLLISVDGMHQSDLDWYIANHPNSELAQLASGGAEFTNNHTSDPSDSDPGGTAIMTGGDPRATGVYYDVEYSHAVDEAGAACTPGQPATGGDVIYDSPDDTLNAVPDLLNNGSGNTFPSFDEGGSIYPNGVDTNPGAIMNLTAHPQSGLNPASFPVDPTTCQPITPWDYLKVNTIFQVIHNAGLRTAWSDKHAIYTSFNGPGSGGMSIDDFFGPEIDSQAVEPNGVPYPTDTDWAHDDAATKQYDGYKVQAVINELNGYDHSGTQKVGVPAILGMNFQTVSVAEKVDSPSTLTENPNGTYTEGPTELAGYYPGGTTPRPAAGQRVRLRQRPARSRWSTRSSRTAWRRPRRSSSPPSTGSRRRTRCAQADRRRADHRRDQRGLDRADR